MKLYKVKLSGRQVPNFAIHIALLSCAFSSSASAATALSNLSRFFSLSLLPLFFLSLLSFFLAFHCLRKRFESVSLSLCLDLHLNHLVDTDLNLEA